MAIQETGVTLKQLLFRRRYDEAVQDIRIKHLWETLDEENKAYKQAKEKGV